MKWQVSILKEVRREVSRTATSDFQRENFGLFRTQVDRAYIFFLMQKHLFLWSSQNSLHYCPKVPAMQNKSMYHCRESTRERKVDKGK